VARFAVPFGQGAEVFVDELGMRIPAGFGANMNLVEVASLARAGSWCLMGEPGAGKSSALQNLVKDIANLADAEPGQDAVLFVPLGEIAERSAFREWVSEPVLGRVPGVGSAGGCLTLVLDGLDECPLPGGSKALASLLERMFEKADMSALRVLVGCRTAEYPDVVGGVLTKVLGTFDRFELAPLSRSDVMELAASRGAAPEAFLTAVADSGTGPLASLPLTLDLLVRQYQDDGGLRGPASRLYSEALLKLADEPDADRDPGHGPLVAGEQILAVAARLCCYLLLCGDTAFWMERKNSSAAGILDPFGLAGGDEQLPGGPFPVTTELITAALHSSLFTSRGPGRLGPAHASFASFLAARHLAAHALPEVQLRSLLTVTTASGSTGIPARLRETAAWLLALNPTATRWLAGIDPVGLAAHTDVIDDPGARELVTERLLADPRAALAGRWGRRWHLAHPKLTDQLTPVLATLADANSPQPPLEQGYLALDLAGDAEPKTVVPLLLEIASRPDLDSHLRSRAASRVGRLDIDGTAGRLRELLEEVTAHPDRDPDDEIRGTVLETLYPGHLPVTDLVAALTEPRRHDLIGAYSSFRRRLPSLLPDEDAASVLRWAAGNAAIRATPPDPAAGTGARLTDTDLADGLLERAFACHDLATVIGPAADLAVAVTRDYHHLGVPAALDERDSTGTETAASRAKRRMLASAILAMQDDPSEAHHMILWGWRPSQAAQDRYAAAQRRGETDYPRARQGLLDSADLPWVLELAADDPGKATVYVSLLRSLFDASDMSSLEAAWEARETPSWPAFAAWFDPIRLGSDDATRAQELFESEKTRAAGWTGAPTHRARVLSLYERAATETSAFAELLAALTTNPDTGATGFRNDDLAQLPGVALLPPGWPDRLGEAAWTYLHQADPPGEACLDHPDKWSLTGEAGYMALVTLARTEAPGRILLAVDSSILTAWAPAILWAPPMTGNYDVKRALLTHLTEAVPGILPGLVTRLLLGHVAVVVWPNRLEPLDAAFTEAVGDVITSHLPAFTGTLRDVIESLPQPAGAGEVPVDGQRDDQVWNLRCSSVRQTFVALTRILARREHTAGIQAAHSIVVQATLTGADEASRLAGGACAVGLVTGDPAQWPGVLSELRRAPRVLRDVLQDLAVAPDSSWLLPLTDDQLAEIWELLAQYWPYDEDPPLRSGFVGPDEQTRHWRDSVLTSLSRRGTSSSVQVLTRLAASYPEPAWLADRIREAEALECEYGWSPLGPEGLTRLIHDSHSRLIRNDSDLTDLVAVAIADAAGSLTTTGQLLWNNVPGNGGERWRPKSEQDVGAWLLGQLVLRLADSGVVINREVLVRQTRPQGLGLTVDIQADAPGAAHQGLAPARCRIELKGNWNGELMTAMQTQLAEDYLLPEGLRDGIYLTAWFDTGLWNDPGDARRTQAAGRDRRTTAEGLEDQAEQLRDRGLRIRSQIIDIPRPTPSVRSRS
jgi:hypothetical protein